MEKLNYNNIKLKFINEEDDFSNLVKKGISFDEEGMCYNDVDDIDSYIEKVKNSFVVYGIYYGNELIGISMIGQVDSLDSDKFAISINIKKEYRGKKLASLLVHNLTVAILEQEKIPFYSASVTNIASQAVAIRSGYMPLWTDTFGTRDIC